MLITIIIIGVLLTIVSSFSWYCNLIDGTSFVINSTSATDDSTVNWWIAP